MQSVLESLRRNDKIHFLFYQNISYADWRKLFRHFFLRLYKREKENESDIKFVFGVPYKLFNGLDTKLEIPQDLIVGEWRDIAGTRDIFGSGLSVSHSQDFLYITNDPETPVPREFERILESKCWCNTPQNWWPLFKRFIHQNGVIINFLSN